MICILDSSCLCVWVCCCCFCCYYYLFLQCEHFFRISSSCLKNICWIFLSVCFKFVKGQKFVARVKMCCSFRLKDWNVRISKIFVQCVVLVYLFGFILWEKKYGSIIFFWKNHLNDSIWKTNLKNVIAIAIDSFVPIQIHIYCNCIHLMRI